MKITVAHSPDSDDAFMFYGLAAGRVDAGNLEIGHLLADIETLNRAAFEGGTADRNRMRLWQIAATLAPLGPQRYVALATAGLAAGRRRPPWPRLLVRKDGVP